MTTNKLLLSRIAFSALISAPGGMLSQQNPPESSMMLSITCWKHSMVRNGQNRRSIKMYSRPFLAVAMIMLFVFSGMTGALASFAIWLSSNATRIVRLKRWRVFPMRVLKGYGLKLLN